VRLERAHAKFVGQGKGLLVVGFSRLDRWGIVAHMDVAEKVQGIRLVAPFLMRTGKRQRLLGQILCLLQVASQHLRLPQGESTERL
jgi:hypothetical protein